MKNPNDQPYLDRLNAFVANEHQYPSARFSGRGIVFCAGGTKYFTNAYVAASILRMHGCELPIQFWHLANEVDDEMREMVKPLGVTCVDGSEIRKQYPVRILNGWELKPYAIMHCPFEEVLFMDADNVAVRNPEYLFETAEYKKAGAIFWPDYGRLAKERLIWEITDIPYRDEPEFESGQIVVDKRRCWKALNVAMHFNEWSDFYYLHVHGDKETFHLAWRKLEQEYAMPGRGIHSLAATMCQHDFEGNRLFQHRNMRKWNLHGDNKPVEDFKFEAECLRFLDELRGKWSIVPKDVTLPEFKRLHDLVVTQRKYSYIRVGYDFRPIDFLPDGKLDAGPGAVENEWSIIGTPADPRLAIFSGGNLLMNLKRTRGNMFTGKWLLHERMPIVLLPIEVSAAQETPAAEPSPLDAAVMPEKFVEKPTPPEPPPQPIPGIQTLHLGCGTVNLAHAVNHDLTKHAPHIDVAHDLNVFPWPWENESFDRIVGFDVFEHLTAEVQQWLDECWRLLRPRGKLEIRVPVWLHENAWTDPTHKRAFTPKTFDYWDKRKNFHRKFGHFYFAESNKWWQVKLVKAGSNLTFELTKDV